VTRSAVFWRFRARIAPTFCARELPSELPVFNAGLAKPAPGLLTKGLSPPYYQMNMNELEAVTLMSAFFFAVVGWLGWAISTNIRRSKVAKTQAEWNIRLLDKLGSSQELLAYLETEAGKNFVEASTARLANPFGRILNAVQAGAILVLLGCGFLAVAAKTPGSFLPVGIIAVALGLGFLASAGIAYVLSKNWGLFEREAG